MSSVPSLSFGLVYRSRKEKKEKPRFRARRKNTSIGVQAGRVVNEFKKVSIQQEKKKKK